MKAEKGLILIIESKSEAKVVEKIVIK